MEFVIDLLRCAFYVTLTWICVVAYLNILSMDKKIEEIHEHLIGDHDPLNDDE
jgi:hypothetical protein